MEDFIDLDPANLESGDPITADIGLALYLNLLAALQGSSTGDGVPYLLSEWHPYNGLRHGDGNDGLIYDFSVDGALGSVETPDFESGYDYLIVLDECSHGSGNDAFSVGLYSSAAAAYQPGNDVTANFNGAGATRSSRVEIFNPLRSKRNHFFRFVSPGLAGAGGFSAASATTVLRARITAPSNFDNGQIYMFRKTATI